LINGGNFNNTGSQKRILVAPLNWGLGHATRCIPLIKTLIASGCVVLIAASGPVKALLEAEFPDATFLPIPAYNIRYSRKKIWLPVKLLWQIPGILRTIYRENRWLQQIVDQHQPHGVISDNRFGLHHKTVPCVYITHQLTIKAPGRFATWLAQKIHYYYINKFSECWVPDAEGSPNLAGLLSHPEVKPAVPVTYLGPLSRFKWQQPGVKAYDLLVILSGPEPQRTVFEAMLLKELAGYPGKTLLVRGLPGSHSVLQLQLQNLRVVNHLPAAELLVAIQQSALVLSRSGYTTIMDLVKLRQKAILVPTPGQAEQEYLATYLQQQGLFTCMNQEQFSLKNALLQAEESTPVFFEPDTTLYKNVITNWLISLSNNHHLPEANQ
jgi:uncharacterized protein (TIGR00661 family)